jgi:hypothetical protein
MYHLQVHQAFNFPPSWISSVWGLCHHLSQASSLGTDVHAEKVSIDTMQSLANISKTIRRADQLNRNSF